MHDGIRHVGQPSAEKRFHDDGWDATFFQFCIEIGRIGVTVVDLVCPVPVEVVQLDLHEIPVVFSFIVPTKEHVENLHIAVIGEAEVVDASFLLLFHKPVEDSVVHEAGIEGLLTVHIPGVASDGMQQQVVDPFHLQCLEGVLEHLHGRFL